MKSTHLMFATAVLSLGAALAATAAQAKKPSTAVLVHGAFADGSSWNKVIAQLRRDGIRVISVQNPLTSLADDVAKVIEQAVHAVSRNSSPSSIDTAGASRWHPKPSSNGGTSSTWPRTAARTAMPPAVYAKFFTGKYQHRNLKGGIGHKLPQEAPKAFAEAVLQVAWL